MPLELLRLREVKFRSHDDLNHPTQLQLRVCQNGCSHIKIYQQIVAHGRLPIGRRTAQTIRKCIQSVVLTADGFLFFLLNISILKKNGERHAEELQNLNNFPTDITAVFNFTTLLRVVYTTRILLLF